MAPQSVDGLQCGVPPLLLAGGAINSCGAQEVAVAHATASLIIVKVGCCGGVARCGTPLEHSVVDWLDNEVVQDLIEWAAQGLWAWVVAWMQLQQLMERFGLGG